jgi:Protein of unknown function (DUF2796)
MNLAGRLRVISHHFRKEPPMVSRSIAIFLGTLFPLSTLAAPPHVHGVALLDVAIDGSTLSLHLDSPLDNLVGFEHAAYNPSQKRALDQMVAQLNRPEDLFIPTPAARCKAQKPKLVSAVLEPADKETSPHHGHVHADMDADFVFRCSQPRNLKGMEVKLISTFPRTHQVKVQIAGPRGQSAALLDGDHSKISW